MGVRVELEHMERNSNVDFSINRGIDFYRFQFAQDLSFLPLSALRNGSPLVLSLLMGKDIQKDLESGVNPNGVTERSPFLTPLVWVAFLFMFDWEKEKQVLRNMLFSPVDCNYIGLCGFNLFHFYLVQSLVIKDGFQKLQWWVDQPMVDCNVSSISIHDRPRIVILHPTELITRLAPRVGNKKHLENVILYLISRGMSCHYLGKEWAHLVVHPPPNKHIAQRIRKQQNRPQPKSQVGKCLPTPQMNNLEDISYDQHLCFTSANGLVFRFHGSYMDMIIKTHQFPFTMETIPQQTIQMWLQIFEKEWVPREEFVMGEPPSFCLDVRMDGDKLFLHQLNSWIYPIYPYSRMIMLTTFPLTERMYEYMCMKLRTGMFRLRPFQEECETSWKNFFLWACYDCIHEFLFANQFEELISQLDIFYSLKTSFLHEYPDVDTFIFLNNQETSVYWVYSREFDYTMYQVYQIFKKMTLFMKKTH